MQDSAKTLVDGLAVGGTVASVTGILTSIASLIASLFTIVWLALRIYESDTVKAWIAKKDDR
jgi:ABC-type Na+ efflux pump permease subunit